MNKSLLRPIIIVSIIVTAVIIACLVIHDKVTTHTITVNDASGVSVSFYQVLDDAENTLVNKQTLSKKTTISVKDGDYCATPTDTLYDLSPMCATVAGKDVTLTINPPYSTAHLSDLLTVDLQSQLKGIIADKYQPIIDQFTVDDGALYNLGEYYGTTLTAKVAPQDRGDVYRVILKKTGNAWSIVAPPQLALSKYTYPTIPFTVLTAVNLLPGSS